MQVSVDGEGNQCIECVLESDECTFIMGPLTTLHRTECHKNNKGRRLCYSKICRGAYIYLRLWAFLQRRAEYHPGLRKRGRSYLGCYALWRVQRCFQRCWHSCYTSICELFAFSLGGRTRRRYWLHKKVGPRWDEYLGFVFWCKFMIVSSTYSFRLCIYYAFRINGVDRIQNWWPFYVRGVDYERRETREKETREA